MESTYLHTHSSGYVLGGGGLNSKLEARGVWSSYGDLRHVTWKGAKAVRLSVDSFLPQMAGRTVLTHEDSHAVYHVLAGLSSRSREMMAELRRLWCMLDTHGTNMHARYIRWEANTWVDGLRGYLDSDERQLDPLLFVELKTRFGWHSSDRFASAMSARLPSYTAA